MTFQVPLFFNHNYLTMNKSEYISAGYLQFEPLLGDPCENMNRIGKLLDKIVKADLIVLPELANSGYKFESREQAIELSEVAEESIFVDFLATQAKKHKIHIVSGFNERENDKLYNTAILVGPDGMIGRYRKIHLFMDEPDIFEIGNLGLPVFDIGKCKIGMLICFDWIFPEVWRILSLQGAEIICHPSNLVLPYAQQAVPVHGLINRTFNITANRTGNERGIKFTGQSIISDPSGNTLFKASSIKEEVKVTSLNLSQARNKMITPRNHLFNDRQPKNYSILVE